MKTLPCKPVYVLHAFKVWMSETFDWSRDMNRSNPNPLRGRRSGSSTCCIPPWMMSCIILLPLSLLPTGLSAQEADFGDAPDSFPVQFSQDGARHLIGGVRMGNNVDAEQDGQSSADALKDDMTGDVDDEDGVVLVGGTLVAGQVAQIRINMQGQGEAFINGWIDFVQNGDWVDEGEHVIIDAQVGAGTHTFTVPVPAGLKAGVSFARFRISTQEKLSYKGAAQDGEVEDYAFNVGETQGGELDFGDAPDSYGTKLANNGPRHSLLSQFYLGENIDLEPDGQPSAGALGDDQTPSLGPDDEDGVALTASALKIGQLNDIKVLLTGSSGRLDAWVDFNQDGTFDNKTERIFFNEVIVSGANTLSFGVPQSAKEGSTYARFRLSQEGVSEPTGAGGPGEVEDYYFEMESPQGDLDFGDAPQSYPVTLAQNGAAHVANPEYTLGKLIDIENDGQPDTMALGDDSNPAGAGDDEDGVSLVNGSLMPGTLEEVDVELSAGSGRLDAWVDFNRDGDWDDKGERIFLAEPLAPGVNRLNFFVPANASLGATYSRWRLSREGGLATTGVVNDGEVEDHMLLIEQRTQDDCVPRTHRGRDFWLTFPGNLTAGQTAGHKLELCISGAPGTMVLVEMPGLTPPFSKSLSIGATGGETVQLPRDADLHDEIDVVLPRGIHVSSDEEVAVYAINRFPYTTEGYLGLPTDVIVGNYVIQSYPNVQSDISDLNGSQFAIVATQNDTTVAITPSVTAQGHAAGVSYNVLLNRGDTYQLRSDTGTPTDLSGTTIQPDKPVGVFGSHQCAFIESPSTFFCDYMVEQLLPVNRAGTRFYIAPLQTRTGDLLARVTAHLNNTEILVNGVSIGSIMAGDVKDITLSGASVITLSRPAFVTQYSPSSDQDGVVDSDPFMVNLQHASQFLDKYEICIPDYGFSSSFLTIIAPNAAVGNVTLNGGAIPAGSFTTIGASGYAYTRPSVAPGVHILGGSHAFGVIAYGWNEYESFGYPGGLLIGDSEPPVLTCPVHEVTLEVSKSQTVGGYCQAILPDFRSNVQVSDDCSVRDPIVQQFPPPGTFLDAGVHNVFLHAQDDAGNIGYCVIKVTVVDSEPGQVMILCPDDISTTCTSALGAVVDYTVLAAQGCHDEILLQCTPPSGSLFPPGMTTVNCTAVGVNGSVATCSFNVTVVCKRNPPGVVKIPDRVRHLLGEIFQLNAEVENTEGAKYQWFRNGEPIEGATDASYQVMEVSSGNTGLYWLSVRNEFGVSFSNRSLLLVGTSFIEPQPTADIVGQINTTGFPLKLKLLNDKQFDVQFSTDLLSWTTIGTVSGGTTEFRDTLSPGKPKAFYRIIDRQ